MTSRPTRSAPSRSRRPTSFGLTSRDARTAAAASMAAARRRRSCRASVEQLEPPPRAPRGDCSRPCGARGRRRRRASPDELARESCWRRLGPAVWRPATAVAAAVLLVIGAVAGYLIGEPNGGGTTTLQAQAMPNAKKASGTLERDGNSGILSVQGMPTLPRAIRSTRSGCSAAASSSPRASSCPARDRSAEAAVPDGLDGADAVLVTQEPRGGSRQPTSVARC